MTDPVKKRRGFAAMDPEKQRELARRGGLAVDPTMRAFSRNRTLAAEAGRKGGQQSHASSNRKRVPA
jgi:general stress protein YciG